MPRPPSTHFTAVMTGVLVVTSSAGMPVTLEQSNPLVTRTGVIFE